MLPTVVLTASFFGRVVRQLSNCSKFLSRGLPVLSLLLVLRCTLHYQGQSCILHRDFYSALFADESCRSRRGANNVIRGPQSALTDFLASNNISAAQIRSDYERRQRQAQEQHAQESPGSQPNAERAVAAADGAQQVESAVRKSKRKREQDKAVAKIRQGKNAKNHKKAKGGDSSGDDDDYDLSIDMYSKKKPLPGQLENCEVCSKRFTVTPYSKTGPDGGLLCPICSKEQETERKRDEKAKQKSRGREKRRQTQSNLLDGIAQVGPRTLLDLCLKVGHLWRI